MKNKLLTIFFIVFSLFFFNGCIPETGEEKQALNLCETQDQQEGFNCQVKALSPNAYSWDFSNKLYYDYSTSELELSKNLVNLKAINESFEAGNFNRGKYYGTFLNENGRLSLKEEEIKSDSSELHPSWTPKYNNIVGYWKFNNSWDSEVGSHAATPINGAGFGSSKLGSDAALFDNASDQYAEITDHDDFDFGANDFTVAFWVRRTEDCDQSGGTINNLWGVNKWFSGGATIGQNEWVMGFCAGSVNGRPNLAIESGSTTYVVESKTTLEKDRWHHLVGIREENFLKIYFDGVFQGSTNVGTVAVNNVGRNLYVAGSRLNNYHTSGFFDEVAIWKDSLTEAEVAQLYKRQVGKFSEDVSMDASWTPEWDNLIGYWKMENDWLDSSGEGKHMTAIGSTFSETSKVGEYAGSFDGSSNYSISTDDLGLSGDARFSMMAWIYWDGTSWSTNYPSAMGNNTTSTNSGIHMTFNNGNPALDFWNKRWRVNRTLDVKTWYHVAFTKTPGLIGSTTMAYINGEEVSAYLHGSDSVPNIIDSEAVIGRLDGTRLFNGFVDEASFWNTDLRAETIKEIYNRQKQKFAGSYESPVFQTSSSVEIDKIFWSSDLPFGKELPNINSNESRTHYPLLVSENLMRDNIGLWHLNETTLGTLSNGDDYADFSGNENHGKNIGGAESTQGGVFNNGLLFDGTDDHVRLNNISQGSSNEISMSAWIYIEKTTPSRQYILDLRGDGTPVSNSAGILVDRVNDDTFKFKCFLQYVGLSPGSYSQYRSDELLKTGKWHHVACSRSLEKVTMVINGKVIPPVFEAGGTNNANAQVSLDNKARIGTYSGASSGSNYWFNGKIDEVALWKRALSNEELQGVYRRGANRIKVQVRSCDDPNCAGEDWQGPDHLTGKYYFSNELHPNREDSLFPFSDFSGFSLAPENFFQYKINLEAEEMNSVLEQDFPEITSFKMGQEYFPTDGVVLTSLVGAPFRKLTKFIADINGSCDVRFQISQNKVNWFYINNGNWTPSSTKANSSPFQVINSHLDDFPVNIGQSRFYFKAVFYTTQNKPCSVESIVMDGIK